MIKISFARIDRLQLHYPNKKQKQKQIQKKQKLAYGLGLLCLTTLIFQQYRGGQFYW